MLTQEFDRETTRYLSDILAQENTTRDELIRNLIRDRWLMLHQQGGIASKGQIVPGQAVSGQIVPSQVKPDSTPGQAFGQPVTQPEPGQSAPQPLQLAADLTLDGPEAELPRTQVALLSLSPSAHRPKNPKKALAEFVKRRNQRVCAF
ncbi:MAG: hypothetical protein ACKO7W_22920 [Elainella sp.]